MPAETGKQQACSRTSEGVNAAVPAYLKRKGWWRWWRKKSQQEWQLGQAGRIDDGVGAGILSGAGRGPRIAKGVR
jgi:hypothetical protein